MATETVTLPRTVVETIKLALKTGIDVGVAVQDICNLGHESGGLESGAIYAIHACLEKQDDVIPDALQVLEQALEAANG
jgi:hypothetical protein